MIRAGQPIDFKNADATLHNVRGNCKINPTFNFIAAKIIPT
jgi:hypothetical protein